MYFGGIEVPVDYQGNGIYPAHPAGRVTVEAVDDGGNRIALQNGFTYVQPTVAVNTITPARLTWPHDEEIVITGAGFTPGVLVSLTNDQNQIGTPMQRVRVINDTMIKARPPRKVPGTYGVLIRNPHKFDQNGNPDPAFAVFRPAAIEYVATATLSLEPSIQLSETPSRRA